MNILRTLIAIVLLTTTIASASALPYGSTWGSYPYYPTTYISPAYTYHTAYGTDYPNPWMYPRSNSNWFSGYRAYTHQAVTDPVRTAHAIPYLGQGNARYWSYHSPG